MLPYFSKPKRDELFTSWFSRISYGNITDPYRLATHIFGSYVILNVDSDLGTNNEIVRKASDYTGIAESEISESFLSSLIGNYLTDISSNGHNPQILGCRIVSQIRRGFGQQFCPQCLQEDAQPYFRKQWRLTYSVACLKHQIVLSDRCMACGAPINYHKLTCFHPHIAFCYFCGRELFKQTEYTLLESDPILWLQKKLEQGYNTGWVQLSRSVLLRTPVFLSGLQYVVQSWLGERSSDSITKLMADFRNEKFRSVSAAGILRRMSALSVLQRYRILDDIAWLLMDWPMRFVDFCKNSGLTPKTFYRTDRYPPYWLYLVLYWELNRKPYWVCFEEIKSAGRFLYKKKYKVSPGNIATCVGLDRSVHLTKERKRYIARMRCLQKGCESLLEQIFYFPTCLSNS